MIIIIIIIIITCIIIIIINDNNSSSNNNNNLKKYLRTKCTDAIYPMILNEVLFFGGFLRLYLFYLTI